MGVVLFVIDVRIDFLLCIIQLLRTSLEQNKSLGNIVDVLAVS